MENLTLKGRSPAACGVIPGPGRLHFGDFPHTNRSGEAIQWPCISPWHVVPKTAYGLTHNRLVDAAELSFYPVEVN